MSEIICTSIAGDNYASLMAFYQQCGYGDTLKLIAGKDPTGAPYDFFVSQQLNWTNKNPINIEATGVQIRPLGGSFIPVLYGAPAGSVNGDAKWRGGLCICGMAVQNCDGCDFDVSTACGPLQLISTDVACAYNHFRGAYSGIGAPGNANCPSLKLIFAAPGSCIDATDFRGCQMSPGSGGPLIQFHASGNQWTPSLFLFDGCQFEQNAEMFDVDSFQGVFRDCYWEGSWSTGNLGTPPGKTGIELVRPRGTDWWTADPRIAIESAAVRRIGSIATGLQ